MNENCCSLCCANCNCEIQANEIEYVIQEYKLEDKALLMEVDNDVLRSNVKN